MTTLNQIISVKGFKNHNGQVVKEENQKVAKSLFHAAIANHRPRAKRLRIQYQDLPDGSTFFYEGMRCLKLGNYGATDLRTGKDVIPALFDYVTVIE